MLVAFVGMRGQWREMGGCTAVCVPIVFFVLRTGLRAAILLVFDLF